uniref:Uncharacterized protein n=1 Tax=Anguilla anguilla TaxID=7936 RepID=A0A0E9W278_ANGAN
MSSALARPWR